MNYNLVDTKANNYQIYKGTPYVKFDAGKCFKDILSRYYPEINFNLSVLSERNGRNRKEYLFEAFFDSSPSSKFYIYCFQTEGGGRSNMPNEGRIQWREHNKWTPDLNTFKKALIFEKEFEKQSPDLTNKELYIFSFYKRSENDKDIVISAVFPSLAQNHETNSTSPRSIQFSYLAIQEAFLKGYSQYQKTNDEYVVNFKPEYLFSYMKYRDQLHKHELNNILTHKGIIRKTDYPYNLIYYGPPGTGKSNKILEYAGEENSIVTTFHPDTDYSTFVGSYKPVVKSDGSGDITYSFIPQTFLSAYIRAWKTEEDTFLIIEEINRGNCAQIFGDIFQLIERDEQGYSKYKINVDSDIQAFIKDHFTDIKSAAGGSTTSVADRYLEYFESDFSKIALPNNLYIHATMNTSDQSLFPMDSAFKRRWEWEYVPINFDGLEAEIYEIEIDDKKYSWKSFVEKVNKRIALITESDDKQIGQFFVKSYDNVVSEKTLINKVLFYLWNDVLKDESIADANYFFKHKQAGSSDSEAFKFNDLFSNRRIDILKGMMEFLEIQPNS